MPTTAIDIVMRFLVDKGSEADAKAALANLEKAGLKFNEKAGRFTSTGGRFAGGTGIGSQVGQVVSAVNATPERVWRTLIQNANEYGTSISEAANMVAKLGVYGNKTQSELMDLYTTQTQVGVASSKTGQAMNKYAHEYSDTMKDVVKSVEEVGTKTADVAEAGPFEGWKDAASDTIAVSKQMGLSMEQSVEMMAPGLNVTNQQLQEAVDLYGKMGAKADDAGQKVSASVIKSGREVRNFFRYSYAGVAGFMAVQAGAEITRVGKALISPIQDYVKYVGRVTEAGNEWAMAQDRISASTVRVGGVMANQVAPVLKLAADLAEKMADIFEKYPGLATAVVGVAGVTYIVGTALTTIGQLVIGITAMKAVAMALGNAAAGAAGTGGILGGIGAKLGAGGLAGGASALVTSLIPIVVPAVLLYLGYKGMEAISANQPGNQQGNEWWRTGSTAPKQTGWDAIWQVLTTDVSKITAAQHGVSEFGNAVEEVGNKATEASSQLSQVAVDAFVQFQQQNTDAEREYEEARTKIIEDAGKRRVEIEKNAEKDRLDVIQDAADAIIDAEEQTAKSRASAIKNLSVSQAEDWYDLRKTQQRRLRDYQQAETRSEEDYYDRRLKAVADFGLAAKRAEEDHQLRIEEMRREHEDTVEGLLEKQDAFGLLAENKRYEEERRQEEEKYNLEVARRNEDLALRLAEMEKEFAQARELRAVDQAQRIADEEEDLRERQAREAQALIDRLAEMDAELAAEKTKIEENKTERLMAIDAAKTEELNMLGDDFREQLAELDKNYKIASDRRQAEFNDQLRQLDAALLGETALKGQWYQTQAALLASYIASAASGTSLLPGYPTTPTPIKKKQSGGPIDREGLYYLHSGEYVVSARDAAMMRAGVQRSSVGMPSSLVLYQNYSFAGSFTEGDKRWFSDEAKNKAYEAFTEIIQ